MRIVALSGRTYLTVRCAIELYEFGNWEALEPIERRCGKSQVLAPI